MKLSKYWVFTATVKVIILVIIILVFSLGIRVIDGSNVPNSLEHLFILVCGLFSAALIVDILSSNRRVFYKHFNIPLDKLSFDVYNNSVSIVIHEFDDIPGITNTLRLYPMSMENKIRNIRFRGALSVICRYSIFRKFTEYEIML